jgi:hypothetical protein
MDGETTKKVTHQSPKFSGYLYASPDRAAASRGVTTIAKFSLIASGNSLFFPKNSLLR